MALRADDVDFERDRVLVRRFQAGDDDAFDELYRRYHDRVERFCRKRVADRHTAEEVTQEAFTRAFVALPGLSGELRFYPWVSVIAARLCIDCHRRLARSEPAGDVDPGTVAGGQDDIVDAVDGSLVVAALAKLTPRYQDVLHLREIEGWSYQRIADHYGVPIGTVETLLFRARRALRKEFHLADGAGLAAIPLFGRVVQVAGRLRSRLPAWLPSAASPTTMAAAVTASAVAVAFAVVPSHVPDRSSPHPPARSALAPATATAGRAHRAPGVGGATTVTQPPAGGVAGSATVVPDLALGEAPAASRASGATPAPGATTTTTTTPAAPVGSGRALPPPASVVADPIAALVAPAATLTVPPLAGGVVSALPALDLPVPTLPGLDLPTAPSSVVGAASSTVTGVVGGLISRTGVPAVR